MQLKYITSAILITAAVAAPVENAMQTTNAATAELLMSALQAKGCDTTKCVLAVAGTTAACTAAAAEWGLNPIADALCFFSLKDGSDKKPCKNCF